MIMCQWFAMCEREATGAARGPIGGGEWGYLPVCVRCSDRFELEVLPIIIEVD
jgi:hypothetical protein